VLSKLRLSDWSYLLSRQIQKHKQGWLGQSCTRCAHLNGQTPVFAPFRRTVTHYLSVCPRSTSRDEKERCSARHTDKSAGSMTALAKRLHSVFSLVCDRLHSMMSAGESSPMIPLSPGPGDTGRTGVTSARNWAMTRPLPLDAVRGYLALWCFALTVVLLRPTRACGLPK